MMKIWNTYWKKICFIKQHDAQIHPFQVQMQNHDSSSQLPHSVMSDSEGDFQELIGCGKHLGSKTFSIRKNLFIVTKEQGIARYCTNPHPPASLRVGKRVGESEMKDWIWTWERVGGSFLICVFITKHLF